MPNFDFETLVSSTLKTEPETPALPPTPVVEATAVEPPAPAQPPVEAPKKGRPKLKDATLPPKRETPSPAVNVTINLTTGEVGGVVLNVLARAFRVWTTDADGNRHPLVARQFPIETDEAFCQRASEAGFRYNETVRMNTLICDTAPVAGDASILDAIKGDEVQVDASDTIMRKVKPGSKVLVSSIVTNSGFNRFYVQEVK